MTTIEKYNMVLAFMRNHKKSTLLGIVRYTGLTAGQIKQVCQQLKNDGYIKCNHKSDITKLHTNSKDIIFSLKKSTTPIQSTLFNK